MYSASKLSIVAAAVSVSLLFAGCDSNKTEEEYLSSAKSYIEQNQHDSAIIELKGALRLNVKSAETRYLLGQAYLALGNGLAAEKEFERALTYGSSDAVAGMIKALLSQREFEQIVSFVDELAESAELTELNNQISLTYKAIALYRLGNLDEAGSVLAQAINNQPDNDYLKLAKVYQHIAEGNELAALAAVKQVVQQSPEFLDALLLQGQLELALNQNSAAVSSFEKFSVQQPLDNITKLLLVNALIKNSEHERAEPIIDQLLSMIPNHAYTNQLKGLVRYAQNDFEQAKLHIEKAIQNGLDSPENKLIAGFSAYNLKNFEQSHSYLVGLSEMLSPSHPAMRLLAITQMKLGYPVEASQALLKLESLSDNDMQLYTAASLELLGLDNQQQIAKMKRKVQGIEPEDAQGFLNKAKLQLSLNDITAVANLERSLELNANSSEAKVLLATEYLRAGNYNKALKIANDWMAEVGENVEALNIVAMAHLGGDKEEQAIGAMHKALSIDEYNALSLSYLAEKSLREENYQDAKSKLEKLLLDKPDYIAGLSTYFFTMTQLKQPELALSAIKSSQEKNASSISHTLLLAKAYSSLNNNKAIISLLSDMPKSAKLPALYWVSLGNALVMEGESAKVTELYQEWSQLQPKQKLAWVRVAVTAEQNGQYAEGLLAVTQGLKFIPNDIDLLILQTHFYIKNNNISMAQQNINNFEESIKSRPGVENLQGKILVKQGRYQQALPKLNLGYQAAPSSKNAVLIFNVYKALDAFDKAEEFALAHIGKYPQQLFVRNVLAENYAAKGRIEEATSHYREIVKADANNIVALNNLAWYEMQSDNLVEADKAGTQAMKLAPDNVNVLDTVAAVKLAMGNKAKAIELLRKAVELAPNNTKLRSNLLAAEAQ